MATPAQAFVLAGLVRLGSRRPVLVVTPTGAAAAQLAHDLEAFTGGGSDAPDGPGDGRGLPGLGDPALRAGQPRRRHHGPTAPAAVAAGRRAPRPAPARASWWPRSRRSSSASGPWRTAARPVVVAKGDRVVVDELVADLVAMGYRRESMVEHRGELAVRGGIVDVFPSTADEPVRIDLWGDEVDRLTRFDVADQRSIDDLAQVELFGCRELVADEAMRKRAAGLVGSAPWGRHQWDRLADGEQFDGMESWLPWLVEGEELICDLLRRRRPGGAGRAPPGPRPGRRAARRGVGAGRRPGRHLGARGR